MIVVLIDNVGKHLWNCDPLDYSIGSGEGLPVSYAYR